LELKREILFEIVGDLFRKYRVIWAKPALKQFFDDLYFKRDIFNEEQKRGVEDYKANLQNLRNTDTMRGSKKDFLDSKIMSNPLNSAREVRDGRSTTFSTDGINKWANKQLGV